jgi:hypothetical protein
VSDDLAGISCDAYVYGFALVFAAQQVARFTREGMGSLAAAPFNAFSHATALAGPGDRFVSINNDTVYNFAYVGRRATGVTKRADSAPAAPRHTAVTLAADIPKSW